MHASSSSSAAQYQPSKISSKTSKPSPPQQQQNQNKSLNQQVLESSLLLLSPNSPHPYQTPDKIAPVLQEFQKMTGTRLVDDPKGSLTRHIIALFPADRALATLRFLQWTPTSVSASVQAFAAKKSLRGVESVQDIATYLGLLKGPESRDTWLSIINAYGVLERLKHVRSAFQMMHKAGAVDATHDTHAINIYLHALHTDIKLVFTRVRQLIDSGNFHPDCSTFNILLKACMVCKDARRAELALSWAQQYNTTIGDGDNAIIVFDEITYNSLIRVYSYSNQFEKALQVRGMMEDAKFQPTPSVWGSLLIACGNAKQLETAEVIWRDLKNIDTNANSNGDTDSSSSGMQSQTYTAMMTACNACHRGERALEIFEEAKTSGGVPDVRGYNLALKACESPPGRSLSKDQLFEGLKIFNDMKEAAVMPDTVSYSTLIELCAQAKHGHIAKQLAQEAEELGVEANVVMNTSLLKALGNAGLVDDCMAVFKTMVWGPKRTKPNAKTFRTLIQVLRNHGDLGLALEVYDGMRRAGYAPNNLQFQELTAAAAEVALRRADTKLQQQVARMCGIISCTKADLHGMSVYEARAAVLCMLSLLQTQSLTPPATAAAAVINATTTTDSKVPRPLDQDVVIITGRGQHSLDGEAKIKAAVLKLLRYELSIPVISYDDDDDDDDNNNNSSIRKRNAGRLVIPRQAADDWLKARLIARQLLEMD
jgi:pentatricopeptide repeat protein